MSRTKYKYNSAQLMNLGLALISAGVVIKALHWPFQTALFPVVVGICSFIMSISEFLISVYETGGEKQEAIDFQLSEDINPAVAKRRTFLAFGWIIGFFFLILLFDFNIGIVLYVFLYTKVQRKEKWLISILMTAGSWFFFWGLFIWILETPMRGGLIFRALRAIGIG